MNVERNVLGDRYVYDINQRWVTVLMCDIVGSTKLSEQLAPIDLMHLLISYYSTCTRVISAEQGKMIRYVGDAVIGLFEANERPEQNVKLAITAAQSIVSHYHNDAVHKDNLTESIVRVRVSIATGQGIRAVYRDCDGGRQELVFGDLPFRAEKMKAHARPNGIVLCETTAELGESSCPIQSCNCSDFSCSEFDLCPIV